MTRPNITPGHWHVSSLDQIWDETGDIKIAETCELPRVYIAGAMRPNSEQETANSKAIAAVPALLEALEMLVKESGRSLADLDPDISGHKPLIAAYSALIAAGYQF